MNLKRRLDAAEERTEVKKCLYSKENGYEHSAGVPEDGKADMAEIPSSENGLFAKDGGIVIKSFYRSPKILSENRLERKADEENIKLEFKESRLEKIDRKKSLFSPESNSILGTPSRKRKLRKMCLSRSGKLNKNDKLNDKKKFIHRKPLDYNKNLPAKQSTVDGCVTGSTDHSDKKFFRNRSPKKVAMLSKRGPAILINRGNVKFQLKCGPKIQRPVVKTMKLVKNLSLVEKDFCNSAVENVGASLLDTNSDLNAITGASKSPCRMTEPQLLSSSMMEPSGEVTDVRFDVLAAPFSSCQLKHGESMPDLFAASETLAASLATGVQSGAFNNNKQNKPNSPSLRSPRQRTDHVKLLGHPKKSEQMILDFGQKLIGSVPCTVCGMTYLHGDKADEVMHNKFHQHLLSVLKFPGWQKERIVQEFLDGSRIILVVPDDKFALKKVEAVKTVVDEDLGFVEETSNSLWKAFLYIKEKRIVGFCLAQSISQGFRMLGNGQSSCNASERSPYCCVDVPVSVPCGISRIWVLSTERRRHVATRLLDVVRSQFVMGCPLSKNQIAFSDPTPDGIKFATKYSGTSSFLVFRK